MTHNSPHRLFSTALKSGAALLIGGMLVAGTALAQDTLPRTADGFPDISGMFTGGVNLRDDSDLVVSNFGGRGGDFFGFEEDNGLDRLANRDRPLYKPEYWDVVKWNDYNGNWIDPLHQCNPTGLPGMGVPAQIVKVEGRPAIILMYQDGFGGFQGRYNPYNRWRWVWIDGRDHDPAYAAQENWDGGSAVGRFEGETLVVETVGFTDESWLHKSGYMHGFNLKITERFWRDGNRLVWQATMEDPDFLMEPWTPAPQSRNLNSDVNAVMGEDLPCRDVDSPLLTSPTRSG